MNCLLIFSEKNNMFSQEKQQAVLSGQGRIPCPKLQLQQRSVLYENNHQIIDVRNRYWVATSLCTERCFRIGILQKFSVFIEKKKQGEYD